MADFEIEPQRPQIGGSVTIPDLSGGTRRNVETLGKAQEMLQGLAKQYQDTQDANALISYKERLNHLDEQVSGIRDPATKINIYKVGQGEIGDQLLKDFPSISTDAYKRIQFEMASDFEQHFIRTTTQAREDATKDFEAHQKDTINALKVNQSPSARQALLKNALDYNAKTANNGFLTEEQNKAANNQLIRAAHEDDADDLSANHPLDYLGTSAEQLGISSDKWFSGLDKAYKQINNFETGKILQEKLDEHNALLSMTPENGQAIVDRFPYSNPIKARFAYLTGKKPVDSDVALADEWNDRLDQVHNQDDADKVVHDAMTDGVHGQALADLRQRAATVVRDIKDKNKDLTDSIVDHISNRLDEKREPQEENETSQISTKNNMFHNKTLRDLKSDLEHVKDQKDPIKAAREIEDRYTEKVDSYYKPTEALAKAHPTNPFHGLDTESELANTWQQLMATGPKGPQKEELTAEHTEAEKEVKQSYIDVENRVQKKLEQARLPDQDSELPGDKAKNDDFAKETIRDLKSDLAAAKNDQDVKDAEDKANAAVEQFYKPAAVTAPSTSTDDKDEDKDRD